MAIDTSNQVLGPNGLPRTTANPDGDRQEIKRLAQQFEAMLLTQMMREMRRSMLDDDEGEGQGLGLGAMTDTGDIAFGDALSHDGGLGLTSQMLDAFQRQIAAISAKSGADQTAQPGSVTNATTAAAVAMPLASPQYLPLAAPAALTLDPATHEVTGGKVSSNFGWRRDPFTGAAKFHNGVDIAAAYGQDVKAAAEGVVAFAGVQKGYGNTVIIDHGAGRQTRYAHLSDSLVRAGDSVTEGQVVGKSGNSGRSTGPHLHFEMLVNGKAVNPLESEL